MFTSVRQKYTLYTRSREGILPRRIIREWEWDDHNLSELGRHGVSRRIVLQVADEAPRFRSNAKGRAATHQMIGPDRGGGFWTICIIESTRIAGRWRAITGWKSDPEDIGWYERRGRGHG